MRGTVWSRNLCSPDVRLALMFAAGTLLFYLAFSAPGIYSIDGNSMLAVAESLVSRHTLVVPTGLGMPGLGGRIYSSWYPLLSILSIPAVYMALCVSRVIHLPFHYLAAVTALPISSALTAATTGVVFLLTIRLGGTRSGAWLAALSFAFGSIALTYARTFLAEPLLTFLTASALYLIFARTNGKIFVASFLAALAVLAKPTGVVIGPVLAAYLFAKRVHFRISILPILGTALGFVTYAGYNFLRFGHPMTFGQPWLFRASFVPAGIAGLLVSPGWGLVWYCPSVILSAWGFRKAIRSNLSIEALAILCVCGGFLLIHSTWHDWSAGWAWGPRYLLPAIPGLCALTGVLEGRLKKTLIFLTAAGFLVNAPTTFSFYERYLAELSAQGIPTDERLAWSFSRAPWLHAWPAALREVEDARKTDVREIFGERGTPSHAIESSRALRVVAIWWWVLPLARIPRWIGFCCSLLLTAIGLLLIVRSRVDENLEFGIP